MGKTMRDKEAERQAEPPYVPPPPTSAQLAQTIASLELRLAELQSLPTVAAERANEARLRDELAQTEAQRKALAAKKARRVELARRFADARLVVHPDLSAAATTLLAEFRAWVAGVPEIDPADRPIRREDFLQAFTDALPPSATIWGDVAGELEDGWPPKGMIGVGIIPPGETAKSVLETLDALAKELAADEELALAKMREATRSQSDNLLARRRIAFAKLAEMSNGSPSK